MSIKIGDEILEEHIRVKVRLDFKSEAQRGRFLFKGKNCEEIAEEVREQQVALLRNVPLQGVYIEDIDMSLDIYILNESEGRKYSEVAYAPVVLTIRLDSLDDLIPIILRSEFRKIEFLSPENLELHRLEAERLFFNINRFLQEEIRKMEYRYL